MTAHDVNVALAGIPVAVASDNKDVGYTVGAGLEYMFAPSWSAKVEYQYYNFGSTNFVVPTTPATLVDFNRDVHTVKLGINYRFNWAGGPGRRQVLIVNRSLDRPDLQDKRKARLFSRALSFWERPRPDQRRLILSPDKSGPHKHHIPKRQFMPSTFRTPCGWKRGCVH